MTSVDVHSHVAQSWTISRSLPLNGLSMNFILQTWQLYFLVFAGCVNREQQEVIEYLGTENQVLREKLGKKRILLSNDQRRRLGVKGKILGRKRLEEIGDVVYTRYDLALAQNVGC